MSVEVGDPPGLSPEDFNDDDDGLAEFLEAEVLSIDGDEDPVPLESYEPCLQESEGNGLPVKEGTEAGGSGEGWAKSQRFLYGESLGKIPTELFPNILKFLSSEDLSMCALVCHFLRVATSDDSLWRRLYCLRWGAPSQANPKGKQRGCAWKQLYFERDQADMVDSIRNSAPEFRTYYVQMQAAKRSQAPLPSQVHDDLVVVGTTVADQVTAWRRSQKLPDVHDGYHWCSGRTCTYNQIGDIFLCEKTGRAHVCDDTCRETVLDPANELLVCTVSGRCFDRWLEDGLEADEEVEAEEATTLCQVSESMAGAEDGESYVNAGRLGRAYELGYNWDEEELEAALRC